MTLYTGGTFDLLHYGHLSFLKRCRALSSRVIVGLNTDEFVRHYKKNSPIMSYQEREKTLLLCGHVDAVVPNIGNEDSKPAILKAAPNILAVGSDWACKDYCAQMGFTHEWLDQHGIVLVYLPYTTAISTTELRKRLTQ